ncbi:hypothetical protein QT971_01545 [Microcoleus sp. herbarium19]|uniref:hypothetical protein n=1 Tax=unclassified Microcoleus TaxID=2642155 RepID=UPI002FD30B4C
MVVQISRSVLRAIGYSQIVPEFGGAIVFEGFANGRSKCIRVIHIPRIATKIQNLKPKTPEHQYDRVVSKNK